jgi:hypothetical protein
MTIQPATSPRVWTRDLKSLDRQAGLHSGIDQVSEDPDGEGIFDRTCVELAYDGFMFGDIHEPELVYPLCSKHMPGAAVLVDDSAMDSVYPRPNTFSASETFRSYRLDSFQKRNPGLSHPWILKVRQAHARRASATRASICSGKSSLI